MRILFLTFYFQPDLCAGSFRSTPLVSALLDQAPEGVEIDVVTTSPNRYKSFIEDAPEKECRGAATIHRVKLPSHTSDMMGQSKAFLTFWRGALKITANRDYDLVFASSSRLMTACLGARISRRVGAPLFLDIRDIFVDTISDVFSGVSKLVAEPFFGLVERWTFSRAQVINLVSEGFRPYFESRYPNKALTFYTNGIDSDFIEALPRDQEPQREGGSLKILYAGNIGEGQGLHTALPILAATLSDRAEFKVIGDGGRRSKLESALRDKGLRNVEIIDPMSRDKLIAEYLRADVLFLHLAAYDAFEKVLPSKIFEYAAVGKPILAGVSGYSKEFIEREVDNAAVFPPGDAVGAVEALQRLKISSSPRQEFLDKYTRDSISRLMAKDVLAAAKVLPSANP